MPFTVAQIVAMAEQLDRSHQMQIIEQLQKSVKQKSIDDYSQYSKLSQLKSYHNIVGNTDDLHNIGMADYIIVTDDKTDENWFNDLHSFIVNNVSVSDLPYSENNRGWTRDELYE